MALATNVLAGVAFYLVQRGRKTYESLALRSYGVFVVLAGLAFAYLYFLFFSHNYAFKYTYQYSSLEQPFFYIVAAFWGGQEGTYLLWLFMCALLGFVVIKRAGEYRNTAMVIFTAVNLFFLLILTRLSPFAMLPFPTADGLGLNPLLRDPWMVIHPPIMFAGYAMAAVPFSIVIAAMLLNRYDSVPRLVFPWVALTSLALGAGNVLGGYWAYKTLGWGGYWGWDPVENSSFIPWMISLALLHGLIIQRRSGALRRTNILMTCLLFMLVLYGTFLTRSGVLGDFSVHSFTDLGVNIFLIGFMLFFLALSVILFAVRATKIGGQPLNYNFYGRDFALFSGMTLLFIVGVVILFWTSLPLLTTAFADEPRAANVATYNGFGLPLAVLMSLMLSASAWLRYSDFKPAGWQLKVTLAAGLSAVVSFGVFWAALGADLVFAIILTLVATSLIMYGFHSEIRRGLLLSLVVLFGTLAVSLALGVRDYMYLLFLSMAGMAAASHLQAIVQRGVGRWRILGGQLTHFGFGIMLIGVLASSAFVNGEKLVIPLGDQKPAFGMLVTYKGMENHFTHPNNRIMLSLRSGDEEIEARPEMYYSQRMDGVMRKPFINRTALGDLYFAPEQVLTPDEHHGLVLGKQQTKQLEPFSLTFNGFSIGEHGQSMGGSMSVAADIDVAYGDTTVNIQPVLISEPGQDGRSRLIEKPAVVTVGGEVYEVAIEQIHADDGAVVLRIPQLMGVAPAEELVVHVSHIPLVNLVWIGTTIVLLGTLIAFLRRRIEMIQGE